MAKIDLPYVQRFRDRLGVMRHYFRKPGCKRVVLPGAPGSKAFMEAYQAAEISSRTPDAANVPAGTMSSIIIAYYQSDEWRALQPQTQHTYRRILDRFRITYGHGPATAFETRHLRIILDKMGDRPGAAQNLLKRLRGVCKFAVAREFIRSDPTAGVRVAKRRSEGFRAWSDGDIEKFEAKWGEGTRASLALYLLLYTGQRRSDVVRMGWHDVRDGVLSVRQQKTGVQLVIPLHPQLLAALAQRPKADPAFLVTSAGRPFSAVGFSNWFRDCAFKAGLPAQSSPHGLRKAAARRLAEAGCSTLEIASITGHASLKEIERYTKSAAQGRLAHAAIGALRDRS